MLHSSVAFIHIADEIVERKQATISHRLCRSISSRIFYKVQWIHMWRENRNILSHKVGRPYGCRVRFFIGTHNNLSAVSFLIHSKSAKGQCTSNIHDCVHTLLIESHWKRFQTRKIESKWFQRVWMNTNKKIKKTIHTCVRTHKNRMKEKFVQLNSENSVHLLVC